MLIPPDLDDGLTVAVSIPPQAPTYCSVLYVRSAIGLAEPTEASRLYLQQRGLGGGGDDDFPLLSRLFRPPFVFADISGSSQMKQYTPAISQPGYLHKVLTGLLAAFGTQPLRNVLQALAGPTISPEVVQSHARLQVLYPKASTFDCALCMKYSVNVEPEVFELERDHSGQLRLLAENAKPLCDLRHGRCVKGHHTNPLGVLHRVFGKIWQHYWTYRTSGSRLSDITGPCPRHALHRAVIDHVVTYGPHDRRFDPLAGRGTPGRESVAGPGGPDAGVAISSEHTARSKCVFCGSSQCREAECRAVATG